MTNIDGLEKALEIMENTRDAMSNTLMKFNSYKESYNKDGISFDINGQGFVRNLKFANGTPPSMIENAINSTIEKVKLHFEEIYFNNLPLEIRQAALDESQKMKALLDMLQPNEPQYTNKIFNKKIYKKIFKKLKLKLIKKKFYDKFFRIYFWNISKKYFFILKIVKVINLFLFIK